MNELNFPSLEGDGDVYQPPELKASKKISKRQKKELTNWEHN